MKFFPNKVVPAAVIAVASFAAALCPTAAFGQDAPPGAGAETETPKQAPEPAGPPQTPAQAAAGTPTPDPLLGFIQRLPPTSYPEDHVRGIYGGSLWSTFHGMQWPYYPKTGIGLSGYVWIDSGYEHIARGNPTEQGTKYWLQQGRLVLRATPTWSDGKNFVQGQAEFVANKDQSQTQPNIVDTDDVWIKAGRWKRWDVQVGRYEGWEVYHFGMGLDLYTLERNGATDNNYSVPQIYGVTYAFYRPAGVGQAALHLYPTDYLRFELGTQFGNEFGSNAIAGRPVAVLDVGWLKVKGGAEYKQLTDQNDGSQGQTTEKGAGGAIQLVVDPYFEVGANGAYGEVAHVSQDGTKDEKGSYSTYSVGGFANVRIVEDLLAGGGYDYTYLQDEHFDPALQRVEKFRHTQMFFALQYLVAKQLFIKAVGAYAKGEFAPNFGSPVFNNNMVSGRLRLQYLF